MAPTSKVKGGEGRKERYKRGEGTSQFDTLRKIVPVSVETQTGAINRLHFLALVFGACFSYHMRLE